MIASVRALQMIPIVASSNTLLVRSDCEQGNEYYRRLWMAIHKQTNARNNLKSSSVLHPINSIEFHLVLVSALPQSHSFSEIHVLLIGERLRENIGDIVIGVYVGVVYHFASMQIMTIMVAHIDVLRSGLDHSGCDMCEGTLIVTVDW